MWARVSRFRMPAERIGDDIEASKEAARSVKDIPGSRGLYYLVDRETGQTMAITLWDDEKSLRASEERANQIRKDSTDQAGGEILGVERYEVAMQPDDAL